VGAAGIVALSAIVWHGGGASAAKTLKVAFLMPCSTCADRFETKDKPYFIQSVKALDPNISVIANNAEGSDARQIAQAESALTNGAKVIIVSPYDGPTGAAIVAKARAQHVPVIAYDGMVTGAAPDFYVSFSNVKVGQLQGQYLAKHVRAGGTIAFINGAQTSDPGRQFKAGAHSALDPLFRSSKFTLGYEQDTDWIPATGQTAMDQALTRLNDKVDGVLAANDGLAGGVITALTARHLNGKVLVTGQDATDAGLQRIILGDQSMTVYKPLRTEAYAAAQLAVDLATGKRSVANKLAKARVNNGTASVRSVLLKSVSVTKSNIRSTVIKDKFTTWAKICPSQSSSPCL
jgi:D-xylose transport system substrate-binding protein